MKFITFILRTQLALGSRIKQAGKVCSEKGIQACDSASGHFLWGHEASVSPGCVFSKTPQGTRSDVEEGVVPTLGALQGCTITRKRWSLWKMLSHARARELKAAALGSSYKESERKQGYISWLQCNYASRKPT